MKGNLLFELHKSELTGRGGVGVVQKACKMNISQKYLEMHTDTFVRARRNLINDELVSIRTIFILSDFESPTK